MDRARYEAVSRTPLEIEIGPRSEENEGMSRVETPGRFMDDISLKGRALEREGRARMDRGRGDGSDKHLGLEIK